ncbi:MAG TPA: LysM peptidoglycan-binding domain-containing protein, partial [Nitrospiraceae bacterium]|nr:LysM peptidoglycan-binding domain-containing protein [Nitrospiraceae bacterium]
HGRVRRLEKLLAQARRQGEAGDVIPSGYAPPSSDERGARSVHADPARSAAVAHPAMAADALTPDAMPASAGEAQMGSGPARVIIVREGETLWRLARRHRVDLNELRQLNGLQDNRIVTGWTLRLPASARAAGLKVLGSRGIMR